MSERNYRIDLSDEEYKQLLQVVEAARRSIEPEDEDGGQEKDALTHLHNKLVAAQRVKN